MLTFPAGALSERPLVFPVVFRGNGLVSLVKPSGVPVEEHPWNGSRADLCRALRRDIAAGKASALALGIASPAPVFLPDAECSGLVLLADRDGNALDFWRNRAGSDQLRFEFLILSKPQGRDPAQTEFSCTLPVAAHFSEPRALISRQTGKKSETRFSLLEKFGSYELWRAESTFPRLHQIRLHAQECALPVVGDPVYGNVPPILNTAFRSRGRLNKGEERPLYAFPCIHLARVEAHGETMAAEGAPLRFEAPLPAGFSALLKKLRASVQPLRADS